MTPLSDAVVSWIRTIVPIVWGSLVTSVLTAVDWLPGVLEYLHLDPSAPVVVTTVTGVAVAAWYSLWRWLEPRIPAWLARVALGSAREPEYGPARGRHAA